MTMIDFLAALLLMALLAVGYFIIKDSPDSKNDDGQGGSD